MRLLQGNRMKKSISVAAFALSLPVLAFSQSSAGNDLVNSVTLQDMKDLATLEGHTIGDALSSGIGISAEAPDGLKYIIRGAACNDANVCVGLEFLVMILARMT